MKRSLVLSPRNKLDTNLFSNIAQHNTTLDAMSPYNPYDNEVVLLSDSDSFSDDPKKMRKKRNAYQKIADDIRVKLLEAVKSGETLKSAAKRFKINYSSAKSILHTFRKEGRILKKSAQERSSKKKLNVENEVPSKAPKSTKKEAAGSAKLSKNEPAIVKKVKTEGRNPAMNVPLGSLSTRMDNMQNTGKAGVYEHERKVERKYSGNGQMIQQVVYEREEYAKQMPAHMAHYQMEAGHHRARKMSQGQEEMMGQKGKYYENAYANPYEEYFDFGGAHAPYQHHANFFFPQEYAAPTEMMHNIHGKPSQEDFTFLDSNAFLFTKNPVIDVSEEKQEAGQEGEDAGQNGQLKNYIDSQNLFRDIRKNSFFSYASNTGFRKGSFDMM